MRTEENARGQWRPVVQCALCEGSNFEELFAASDPHYRIPGSFKISRCRQCSLVFLNPRPDLASLLALYPKDSYYAYQDYSAKPVSPPSTLKLFLTKWLLHIETKDPSFSAPGSLLDVGCGSGAYLAKMRAAGWSVRGVEVSPEAAGIGAKNGLNIFCGTLAEAAYPEDSFDYVRLNHSFEHIPDPNETLREIFRVLKPSGKLLIGVPNIAGLTFRVFGRWWYYLCPPVHVFHYTPATLSRLLKKHGFFPENIAYNSNYHGLLEGLQIMRNRGTPRTADEGWLASSRPLKVTAHRLVKMLDALKVGDCMEITAGKIGAASSKL